MGFITYLLTAPSMNTPNCCEKCEKVIPTDSPDGSLMQLTYCSNVACSCHTAKTSATPDWEKEFDEQFAYFHEHYGKNSPTKELQEIYEMTKNFVRHLLSDQRRELVEEVKALSDDAYRRFGSIQYNPEQKDKGYVEFKAFQQVLALLKDPK